MSPTSAFFGWGGVVLKNGESRNHLFLTYELQVFLIIYETYPWVFTVTQGLKPTVPFHPEMKL